MVVWTEINRVGSIQRAYKVYSLVYRGNEISELVTGTFENMSNLEHLELEHNRLEHLDSDVFSGLVNLKYIGYFLEPTLMHTSI